MKDKETNNETVADRLNEKGVKIRNNENVFE